MVQKYFINLFILILLSSLNSLLASERIADELKNHIEMIPLKETLGEKLYNDAIGSGKYRYVGNSKCRLCHRKFFIGRKNDSHDHAMDNLIATGHDKDNSCLPCHSTGYGTPTGFVSLERTPRLSNVQCEGCHGPGNIHILRVKKRKTGGFLAGTDNPDRIKKMCTKCHTKRWNKSYHDLEKAYNKYKKPDPRTR